MPGTEVRIFKEGAARWVQASATANAGWKTASGAATALVGFVEEGAAFDSGRTVTPIMDRGSLNHFKVTEQGPVRFTLSFKQAVTANMPAPATASGASVPAIHWEVKHNVDELGGGTAQYHQFIHCVEQRRGWREGKEGNVYEMEYVAAQMVGPTASGYIA